MAAPSQAFLIPSFSAVRHVRPRGSVPRARTTPEARACACREEGGELGERTSLPSSSAPARRGPPGGGDAVPHSAAVVRIRHPLDEPAGDGPSTRAVSVGRVTARSPGG